MMNRLSTFTQFAVNTSGLLRAQSAMGEAQQQASTGNVASDLKGFGPSATRLLSAKSVAARLDARVEGLNTMKARAEVEATGLSTFSQTTGDLRSAVTNAIAMRNGAGLQEALDSAVTGAFAIANLNYAGQYIFGGTAGYRAPTNPISLDNLAALPNTDAQFNDVGDVRKITLTDGLEVQPSAAAKEIFQPLLDLARSVRAWENTNGTFDGKLTDAQVAYLQSIIPQVSQVQSGVIDQESAAGVRAEQLDLSINNLEQQKSTLASTISGQEKVDMAEVASRLSAAQTQYQASASIFSQLKSLNLLQYLR